MRKIIFTFLCTGFISVSANAGNDWQQELEDYGTHIQVVSSNRLFLNTLGYSALMAGTCSASAAIVAATALSDSYPIMGFVAESLANLSAEEYQTLEAEAFLSLNTLASASRGALGGGLVAVGETLEYGFLWLSGREDEGYNNLRKVYASTVAVYASLFSPKSKCVMSFIKLAMTLDEMNYRGQFKEPIFLTDEEVTMP